MMSTITRDAKQLGAAFRRVRKHQGLSQAQLGEKAGLRQEMISLIETGNPGTGVDTILRVLAALKLDMVITERELHEPYDPEKIF